VAKVVVLAHRVAAGVARSAREVETLVEHIVLEGGDALFRDEATDLGDLIPDHRRQVIPVVHPRVPTRRRQNFGEDLRVRTTLSKIVAARPEVADDACDAARERRERLAVRSLRDVAVDAKMEVGINSTREYEPPRGVYDLVRVA